MSLSVATSFFAHDYSKKSDVIELSIVMPCLNEAETIASCIEKASTFLKNHGVSGEVLVADNGSSDGSQQIASRLGARVISVAQKGYGSALLGGIAAARGKYIIMGDADDSYNFSELMPFLEKLRQGHELVLGNRFQGGIQKGAMPFLHRYLGNPVLSAIGRGFFGSKLGDFHCGLRGFSKSSIERLKLTTPGMEFASEMIVKATLQKLKITEVPTTLAPDGRSRPPHLRTWRDGWRHLKFLLLFCPRWLFLYPGVFLMGVGTVAFVLILPSPFKFGNVYFDVSTLVYSASAIFLGFQSIFYALFAEANGINRGVLPRNPAFEKFISQITVEVGVIAGGTLVGLGLFLGVFAVHLWQEHGFGILNAARQLRWVIPSVLSLTIGVQTIFSSFFLSSLRTGNQSDC